MLPDKILKEVLKKLKDKITAKDLSAARLKAQKTNKHLEETLISENLLDENEIYEAAGTILGFPMIGLKGREVKKEVLNLIPAPVAGTHQVVAFEKDKDTVKLAMVDPTDIQTIEF